jgi:uncharacterized protein YjbI with pentapeptide repeats
MSDVDGTCEYVLDPDDPETWGGEEGDECYVDEEVLNEDGVWTCPHDAEESEELCIFHLPIARKDSEKVNSALITALEQVADDKDSTRQKESSQFIAAKFGNLDLSELKLADSNNQTIDFTYATFNTAEDNEELVSHNFSEMIFNLPVFFTGADFQSVTFSGTIFKEEVRFYNVNFNEESYFNNTTFGDGVSFIYSKFHKRSEFIYAEFGENVSFNNSTFEDAIFRNVNLDSIDIGNANLIGADFRKSDLTDADLSGTTLTGANLERALLSRCDLYNSDLKGAAFYGAVFGDVQINEETIFGQKCVYDPDFEEQPAADVDDDKTGRLTKAAGQYRIIEQLARTNAFPDMVSHNFVRRQDIHREQHRQEGRLGRWLRATASKYVLEYGENPWRLIATGLVTVVTFGVLYPLVGGLQPTGGSTITLSRTVNNPILLLQSIYYSTLTFTTLGMGDFLPVGMGKVLTTLETSLGAIIIALLVFVFGRRAAR